MKTTFRILPVCLTFCTILSLTSCEDEPRTKRADAVITSIVPSTGVAGTEVVISGSNLQDPKANDINVLFNGIPAEVISITDDEIAVIVPAFASTGAVEVVYEKSKGSEEASAGTFTVPLSGSVDSEFNAGGVGPDLAPSVIKLDHEGRIVIAGFLQYVNGTSRPFIARLNSNGTLDENFDIEAPSSATYVRDFDIASDGSMVMIGAFQYKDANQVPFLSGIARILPDGTHDNTTLTGQGPVNGTVQTVAIQSDGKILLGGNFTSYRHVTWDNPIITTTASRNRIVRLNEDFTLDESFDPGTGFNDDVNDIEILDNGDIMAIGTFSTYNDEPANGMVLLNDDGTPDNSFSTGSGINTGTIHKAVQLPNNNWMVSGTFTGYQGSPAPGLIQLLPNGDRNTAFSLDIIPTPINGVLAGSGARFMDVDSEGRIALGGAFTINDDSRRNLIVIDSDGTLLSFDTGTTFKEESSGVGTPVALAFDDDNNLLVASYSSYIYNGKIKQHLFKVLNDE